MLKTTTAMIVALCAGGAVASVSYDLFDNTADVLFSVEPGLVQTGWVVDGVNQLVDQSFYLQIGTAGVIALADIAPSSGPFLSNTDFDDVRDDVLDVTYDVMGVEVNIRYQLSGGPVGSRSSELGEQITITNNTGSDAVISFIQFADFNLNGDATDSMVEVTDSGKVIQRGAGEFFATETISTPAPTTFQVGESATVKDAVLSGVLDGTALDNTEGDKAFAFKFDFEITDGDSVAFSKVKTITPTPGAMAALGLGMLGGMTRRRR